MQNLLWFMKHPKTKPLYHDKDILVGRRADGAMYMYKVAEVQATDLYCVYIY